MSEADDRLRMALQVLFDNLNEIGGSVVTESFEDSSDIAMSMPHNIGPKTREEEIKMIKQAIETLEILLKAFIDVLEETINEEG